MSARPNLSGGALIPGPLPPPILDENNITAKRNRDGSIVVQFGGCDGKITNSRSTVPDWMYVVCQGRSRLAASTK